MKWLCVLLAACAPVPTARVSIVASAVTLSQIEAVDLYLIEGVESCASVGSELIAAQDLKVAAYQRVSPSSRATFPDVGDGVWLLAAEAYGAGAAGAPIAKGCVRVPPIYRDETTSVTVTLEDAR